MNDKTITKSNFINYFIYNNFKKFLDFVDYPITKLILSIFFKIVEIIFKIFIGILASAITAMYVVPAARVERGYDAIGGEYTLIIATGILTVYLSGFVLEKLK